MIGDGQTYAVAARLHRTGLPTVKTLVKKFRDNPGYGRDLLTLD